MTSQPSMILPCTRTEKEQKVYDMDLKNPCQEKCYEKGMKRIW